MNVIEATKKLKDGYKVRRRSWPNNYYIFWDDSQNKFIDESGDQYNFSFFAFEDKEWEVFVN